MSDPGRSRGRGRATTQQQPPDSARRPQGAAAAQPVAPQPPTVAVAARGGGAGAVPAHGRASHRGTALEKSGDGKLEMKMAEMGLGEGSVTQAGARGGYRCISVATQSQLKPDTYSTKQGKYGNKVSLMANYFPVISTPDWCIRQYHIAFAPEIEGIQMRKALLGVQREKLGVYIFDGMHMFNAAPLESPMEVVSQRRSDNENIRITIKLVKEWPPTSTTALQLFNIIMRKNMQHMKFQQIGRQFYDAAAKIPIPQHKLELWPGMITAIHAYERQLLMCCDLSFKVLRDQSVLDLLYDLYNRDPQNYQELSQKFLLGAVILTKYNNKTYRIDDVDWNKGVEERFQMKDGTELTLRQYFQKQWSINIRDAEQPLIVSRPKKREMGGELRGPVYLIPELCSLTGLTDEMRSDFTVMKDLATKTRAGPDERVKNLTTFVQRLTTNQEVVKEMKDWGLKFATQLITFNGRMLGPERIFQGEMSYQYKIETADWTNNLRSNNMHVAKNLSNWAVICTSRDKARADEFVKTMFKVCPSMGMKLANPKMCPIDNDRTNTFVGALRQVLKQEVDFVVIVVSNNKKDRYDAIKSVCCVEIPVPSQVIVSKTIGNPQKLMSVVTKIAIQMNCKLGGEAWACEIPFKNAMVVGYDSYHDSSQKGLSVGAVVCSTNNSFTSYHSSVGFQKSTQELLDNFGANFRGGLKAFMNKNKKLPERVFVYRDGVGDGQLPQVKEYEIEQMKKVFHEVYGDTPNWPRMTFFVVNKKINTRIFLKTAQGCGNPPPSTVVDEEITRPERYDFFLISQSVRQGTVGPTQYVVIDDNNGFSPDQLQRLSYKMTHLYYNWPGTIRVPAPCQYAHKLAFLVGQSLHASPSDHLADTLFYL